MFECIDCNPSYDVEDKNIDTTYWQERMVYTLNNNNFVYRYSEVYNGYFVSLSMDMKKLFRDMPRAKVNINIDLTQGTENIVGIDYNGFENFEIDTLTIQGNDQTFYVLDKGLYNTKLQTLKHNNSVVLDLATSAINNNYEEVVLA